MPFTLTLTQGHWSLATDTMADKRRHKGFSLTEVLISLGTLAVGMMFIAGVFPVSIHFTTVATERSIAAAAADEAFAKIRLYKLYSVNPTSLPDNSQSPLEAIAFSASGVIPGPNEFYYPSTYTRLAYSKKYWWSAICRKIPNTIADIQVTVFISRKVGIATQYPNAFDVYRPITVPVQVTGVLDSDRLTVTGVFGDKTFINAGCSIVDGPTGDIYRVLERDSLVDTLVRLDRRWQSLPDIWPRYVWVVPPPVGGGRNPCIAIYQKVIRF